MIIRFSSLENVLYGVRDAGKVHCTSKSSRNTPSRTLFLTLTGTPDKCRFPCLLRYTLALPNFPDTDG